MLSRKVKGSETGIYADHGAKGQKRTWSRDKVSGKLLERGPAWDRPRQMLNGEHRKRMRALNSVIAQGKAARVRQKRTPRSRKPVSGGDRMKRPYLIQGKMDKAWGGDS